MELKLANAKKKIEVADAIFACEFNEALIHQVVTAVMAGRRAGTKAQKTRAEVSGGGAKPWRQKGTGRARAGTIRSPIWRTGGKVFAAKPRSYQQKINKKMFKGALRSIWSELVRQERLVVVDDLIMNAPKTKELLNKLAAFGASGNTVIVTQEFTENLYLASRNLPNVLLVDSMIAASDPVIFVRAEKIIITEAALKEMEEKLK